MRLNGTFDTYNMPAPGYFVGEDKVPDFFTSFGKGPWPNTEYTVHTLVDGKNREVSFSRYFRYFSICFSCCLPILPTMGNQMFY